jgi:hypothetical protein
MGGGALEMVLDVKFRFRCRNNSGGTYKITGFTFRRQARKSACAKGAMDKGFTDIFSVSKRD